MRFALMTLNVRFGLAVDGPNGWEHRKGAFVALLAAHPADIVGLQEVNDFQAADIAGMLGTYDCIGKRRPAPPFWQNNLIFFRAQWRCVHHEHFFLSPTPSIASRSRDSRWPRQCTLGLFQHGNRHLVCGNTHLDFDPAVQVASAEAILRRLTRFPTTAPVVLLGDFNSRPDEACHGRFTDPEAGGFHNVLSPAFPGTHHAFTGSDDGRCIDWVLYRGGLVPEATRVIQDSFAGRWPSDHFPIHAVFRFLPVPRPRRSTPSRTPDPAAGPCS